LAGWSVRTGCKEMLEGTNRQTGTVPMIGRAEKPLEFVSKAGWFSWNKPTTGLRIISSVV
jgi:hypothetical protein